MTETIQLTDKMSYIPDNFFLRGHVTILDGDRKLVDQDNHIVITGRNWLMQRMFNMPSEPNSNLHTWLPGWFSVGSGGASLDSPFTPIWPTDTDTDLYHTEIFTETGPLYSLDTKHKLVDSISFPSELTAKLTMTLDYKDFADSYINEAGMFLGPTTTYDNTDFVMFSHVTFPSFPKSQYQKLSIEWYFLF